MKTATEEIQFAVQFAQLDLTALRRGDLLNLRDELGHFVVSPQDHPGPIVGSGVSRPAPHQKDYTVKHFDELQREVKSILAQATDQKAYRYGRSVKLHKLEFQLIQPSGGRKYIYVTGSVQDVFLIRLFFLLAQEGVDNIKTCPECGTIFYKHVGWQKYCSRRCSNLASVKRFQAKQKAKKKGRRK